MRTEPRASPNALQRRRRAGFNSEGATLEMIEVWYKQIKSLQGWNTFTIREERTTAAFRRTYLNTQYLSQVFVTSSSHQLNNILLGRTSAITKTYCILFYGLFNKKCIKEVGFHQMWNHCDSEGLTVSLMYTGCICISTPGSCSARPDGYHMYCTSERHTRPDGEWETEHWRECERCVNKPAFLWILLHPMHKYRHPCENCCYFQVLVWLVSFWR